jgi:AraC-like DNA-binding protein
VDSGISKIATLRFSSSEIPLRDRIAVCRELIGRHYLRLDMKPLGDSPLRCSAELQSWGPVSLLFCESSPLSVLRTPELIRDGNGDFRLLNAEQGYYQLVSKGIEEETRAALLSNGVVSAVHFPMPFRVSSIVIRRELLAANLSGFEDRTVRTLSQSSRALKLLTDYIRLLGEQGIADDLAFANVVGRQLVDLAIFALKPTPEIAAQTSSSLRQARLATIRADVLANLSQVRLSAKTAARRHGFTDRYIHLLFEETGETFSQFVMEERLKRAFDLLTDPKHSSRRISDIASETGFGDLSTFNRAFRRRFGDTPRAVRQSKAHELSREFQLKPDTIRPQPTIERDHVDRSRP